MNHEAWAIPYADLMTLLLAFFVVMYAVSVVNEGKYRVMSESLIQAFNGSSGSVAPPVPTPAATQVPVPVPAKAKAVVSVGRPATAVSHITLPIPMRSPPAAKAAAASAVAATQNLDNIETKVRSALQPLIDRKLVVVRHKKDWLEIEIRTDILFPSGAAQLSTSADAVLKSLAVILADFPNPLRVEGFTDNVPINTPQYPSNWELSAGRAASVARLFALSGVAPDRLGIVGWGDVRPLADNATIDGRNQNRRVLVVVMNAPKNALRQSSDAAQLSEIAGAVPVTPAALELPSEASPDAAPAAAGERGKLPLLPANVAADPVTREQTMPTADTSTRVTTERVSPDR